MASGQLGAVVQHIHRFAGTAAPEQLKDGQLLERFLGAGEESAFAALVRRHGPMVLGVCRRVLRDRHAAEDAFQATFLVLLRRARFLDRRGSVAGWLYTVAYHVALRARADTARRHRRERVLPQPSAAADVAAPAWTDLQPILDEELQRLPETYRAAVLLCYLEGKTHAEAAQLLGWPVGTVKGRLSRARDLLRARLSRRGITLAGGLLATALPGAATAAVSGTLLHVTLRITLPRTAGAAAAGGPSSASAVALAEGALRSMFTTKLNTMAALLLVLGLIAFGVGASSHPAQAQRQDQGQLKKAPAAGGAMPKGPALKFPLKGGKALNKDDELALAGRVLGPDGQALAGADVAILAWRPKRAGETPRVLAQARTDREGKFALKARRPSPEPYAAVGVASAPGCGLAWHPTLPDAKAEIRLQPEEVVRGRLIDLQGQPAAGVKLEVTRLGSGRGSGAGRYLLLSDGLDYDDDPEDYLTPTDFFLGVTLSQNAAGGGDRMADITLKVSRDGWQQGTTPAGLALPEPPAGLPGWPAAVTTDAQGRFVVRGIPRGQAVGLRVRDPRFALQVVDIPAPEKGKNAEVTRVLSPVRVLEGTVTDAATGKPLPRARVKVYGPGNGFAVRFSVAGGLPGADAKGRRIRGVNEVYALALAEAYSDLLPADELPPLEVRADDKGHFRLNLFRAGSYTLRVSAAAKAPYLARTVTFSWPQQAVVRKQLDVGLTRGVLVRGRVTEAPGGKGIAGARVDFWSKGLKLPPGVRHPRAVSTGPDGTFAALLPPGAWHLLVNGPEPVYLYQPIAIDKLTEEEGRKVAPAPKKEVKPGKAEPEKHGLSDAVIQAILDWIDAGEESGQQGKFYPDAWLALDLKPGDGPRDVSVTLRRAPLLRGQVVGPDGKPATGVLLIRRPALPFEGASYLDAFSRRVLLDVTGQVPSPRTMRLFEAGDWRANGRSTEPVELRDGTFTIPALSPKATYPLHFLDARRNLGAVAELQGKQAGGEPVTVRLSPCGSARARFLDPGGKPLADYRPLVWLLLPPGPHPVPKRLPGRVELLRQRTDALIEGRVVPEPEMKIPATDAAGRVTLPGLIPGATYRLLLDGGKARDFTVRPGEMLDLGELTAARPPAPRAGPPAKDDGGPRKTKTKPNPPPAQKP
jgi:RNA polymerase sigma factor (sigma-70 family)